MMWPPIVGSFGIALAFQPIIADAVFIDKPAPPIINQHELSAVLQNSYHIFNSVHGSLRAWDSSRNHNGMSFFPATIPAGVTLYHGKHDNQTVTGLEWLAFEPSFSYAFTGLIYPRNCTKEPEEKLQQHPGDRGAEQKQHSLTTSEQEADISGLSELQPQGTAHMRDSEASPMLQQQTKDGRQSLNLDNTEELNDAKLKLKLSPCPPRNYEPGYLHTFVAKKDLHVLYLDGMSGSKTRLGTLDTQDRILRGLPPNWWPAPDQVVREDYRRAGDLCTLAKTKWNNKIDGIVRMNVGLELILCDFEGGLERTSIIKAAQSGLTSPYVPHDIEWLTEFDIYREIESGFFSSGRDRIIIDYENIVTLYAFDAVELWPNGTDDHPRLTGLSETQVGSVYENVTEMILGTPQGTLEDIGPKVDWQAITDRIVTKYAKYLQDLAYGTESYLDHPKLLHKQIELAVRPFIDFNHRNKEAEIHRCAIRFFPHMYQPSTVATAIYHVSASICSTLLSAETSIATLGSADIQNSAGNLVTDKLGVQNKIAHIRHEFRALLSKLSWPIYKYCSRGCRADEACLTAIWPFGDKEDFDMPSCQDFRGVGKKLWGNYWGLVQ